MRPIVSATLLTLLGLSQPAQAQGRIRTGGRGPILTRGQVMTGAQVLVERDGTIWPSCRSCKPKIALITNRSAQMPDGTPDLDALRKVAGLSVVEVLSPEHGYAVDSQTAVGDSTDRKTGVRIYSLYGKTLAPTAAMLAPVDTVVFDIQDVGVRFYTYISTMYLAMKAAKAHHKRFVVLDRPDPIGGSILEGGVLDPRFRSFTGIFPLPVRHGMTVGELARLFNTQIACDLTVVPMSGWHRGMWWDQTGLPWVAPSPAMVNLASATLYPGMCFLEATNVDDRVGAEPFTVFGAPWLDGDRLASQLSRLHLAGVRFQGVRVARHEARSPEDWPAPRPDTIQAPTPAHQGVAVTVTDRQSMRPVQVALCALSLLHRDYGAKLQIDPKGFDRLAGNAWVLNRLLAGADPMTIDHAWEASLSRFEQERRAFLLYR